MGMHIGSRTALVTVMLLALGCAGRPPQQLINQNDHAGLANYYSRQAQELRDKAKGWDVMADFYEQHRDPHGKLEPKQHAAHCHAIAENYLKSASEADALATEHRAQVPHGVLN